jgi:hypothetical protein
MNQLLYRDPSPPVGVSRPGGLLTSSRRFLAIALTTIPFCLTLSLGATAEILGNLIVAGNGPEHVTIEALARAFEKVNSRAYVEVLWDENSRPVEMVKRGQAQIAVAGSVDPTLAAVQIGWDGIGVYVSLSTALSVVSTGVAVRLLPVDKVEPEVLTVKDGRYGLRRPLVLLSKKEAGPLVDAFVQFVLSPQGHAIIGDIYIPMPSS